MTTVAPPAPDPAVFLALADATRRQLLQRLVHRGGTSASALARELPISRQAVGKHLDLLHRASLVDTRREGREVRYEPQLGPLRDTADWMDGLARQWENRLGRLAAIAESEPLPPEGEQ